MKRSCIRPALSALFALFVCVPLGAQHGRFDTPSPTPRIGQRHELPVARPAVLRTVSLPLTDQEFFYSRPIIRIGQNYTLKSGDTIREVRSVLGDVHIEGHVLRDVVVVMGDVTVSGSAVIDGSLVVIGGSATVDSGAHVRHDFVVIGGTAETASDFSPEGDHVVVGTPMLGRSLRTLAPWLTRGLLMGRLIVPDLRWVWAVVGIGFFVGFLMNQIFNRQVSATAGTLT